MQTWCAICLWMRCEFWPVFSTHNYSGRSCKVVPKLMGGGGGWSAWAIILTAFHEWMSKGWGYQWFINFQTFSLYIILILNKQKLSLVLVHGVYQHKKTKEYSFRNIPKYNYLFRMYNLSTECRAQKIMLQ